MFHLEMGYFKLNRRDQTRVCQLIFKDRLLKLTRRSELLILVSFAAFL